MQISHIGAHAGVVLGMGLAALLPGSALAQEEKPRVPTAIFLDGLVTDKAPDGPTAVCSAVPDASVAQHCFTSTRKLAAATAAALQEGKVPPGWGALPPSADLPGLIEKYQVQAASGGTDTAPPRTAASVRRGAVRAGKKTRKADGYNCSNGYTYIYTDADFVSNPAAGVTGYSGNGNWLNYYSAYDNKGSSFWALPNYTTRWHDYAYGGGRTTATATPAVMSITSATPV